MSLHGLKKIFGTRTSPLNTTALRWWIRNGCHLDRLERESPALRKQRAVGFSRWNNLVWKMWCPHHTWLWAKKRSPRDDRFPCFDEEWEGLKETHPFPRSFRLESTMKTQWNKANAAWFQWVKALPKHCDQLILSLRRGKLHEASMFFNLFWRIYGFGSKRKLLGTTGFDWFFLLPIGFFGYPFLTRSHIL